MDALFERSRPSRAQIESARSHGFEETQFCRNCHNLSLKRVEKMLKCWDCGASYNA
jgi:hypothetical protein